MGRRALVGGTAREAKAMIRSRNRLLLLGAVGYWAWDNAVLWATFHAFGVPRRHVILMGYLIGQLGGLLPLPGGLGGSMPGCSARSWRTATPVATTAAPVWRTA